MAPLGPGASPRLVASRLIVAGVFAVSAAACGDEPITRPTPIVPALTVQCPADVLGQSTTGSPVAIQLPSATTSGGVLPVTVSCAPSGTTFPIGSTRVTCEARDGVGATASCGYNVNVAPPPLSRTRFLAFGDSMTAGEVTQPIGGTMGADGFPNFRLIVVPSASYPSELLRLLRARYFTQTQQFVVTNSGVVGEYTWQGLRRFPAALAAAGPQVVLLLEGANDIEALPTTVGVTDALVALQTMVRAARASGATVLVATLPPVRPGGRLSLSVAAVQSFNAALRAGASSEGAIVVDLHAALSTDVNRFIGIDGLHPTEAGYVRMAETFFATIRATFEGR
jgi:lysophospholipase L1-like esterase